MRDVLLALDGIRSRNSAPLRLWGLRTACLLATEATSRVDEQLNFLLWQPAAGFSPWLNIESARWLKIQSPRTPTGGKR